MKVEVVYTNEYDAHLTDPFPQPGMRLLVRFTKGDVCDPYLDPDGWFGPQKPLFTFRFNSKIPLPYIAWRFGKRAGYIGWKIYGVDSEAYKSWIDPKEVFDGSLAMCLTCRPFATLP